MRLRDIGGIIVVDFIDMKDKSHQQELLKLLSAQAKLDKMKTVVCGISSFGLVEMTRKRARQGLQTLMFDTCPQCGALDACCQAELYTCKLSVVYVSCLNQVALNLI